MTCKLQLLTLACKQLPELLWCPLWYSQSSWMHLKSSPIVPCTCYESLLNQHVQINFHFMVVNTVSEQDSTFWAVCNSTILGFRVQLHFHLTPWKGCDTCSQPGFIQFPKFCYAAHTDVIIKFIMQSVSWCQISVLLPDRRLESYLVRHFLVGGILPYRFPVIPQ